ncbi:MAG: EamA family transporter [Chloroflexi bacterium]|nr:EamA family transporter [Chloroflexota bacterium]
MQTSPSTSRLAIWAGLLTVYVVWGSTYLAIRFAVYTIPPFYMAGVRFLIAGAALYMVRRLVGDKRPTRIEWRSAATIGFFLLVVGNGGVVWAEQHVPSGLAALMVGTVPLWMVLIAMFRPREGQRPGWQTLLGIGTGFLGIGLLFWPGRGDVVAESVGLAGAAVLMISAIAWAYGSLFSQRAVLPSSPLLGTSMEMLAGSAGLFLLGTLSGEASQVNLSTISTQSLLGLVYLIIFGSLIGFAAYTWLLRVAPTSLVSTYAYVNPLVAIFLGNILGNEILTSRTLIAAAVILGSVILTTTAQYSFRKARKAPQPCPEPGGCGDD